MPSGGIVSSIPGQHTQWSENAAVGSAHRPSIISHTGGRGLLCRNHANIPKYRLADSAHWRGRDAADFAIYVQHAKDNEPVLYRRKGDDLSTPDFDRLRANGLSCFHVRCQDLRACENVLEERLREVLDAESGSVAERAQLVAHVGTRVARDLSNGPDPDTGLTRATRLLETVMASVLSDPHVASNMLNMAGHESGVASHMFLVSTLAIMFGQEALGADGPALLELGIAGMMHDIGKLSIASTLLNKEEKLTPEEFDLIQQHPIESVRLLRDDAAITDHVRRLILEHHERIDGQGYPLGLPAHDLAVGSRVLAIVDTFHAMTGRRAYRPSVSIHEALKVMRRNAGRQLDADLLRCWCDYVERVGVADEMESVIHPSNAGPVVSSRHEHRTLAPRRSTFGNRAKRFECHTKRRVRCIHVGRIHGPTNAPSEFEAVLRDASRSGVCMFAPQAIYRGEMLNIFVDGGSRASWVRGVVAWCRRHDDAGYRAGIQFLHRISEEEIRRKVPVRTMAELQEILLGPSAESEEIEVPMSVESAPAQADDPTRSDEDRALDRLRAAQRDRKVSARTEADVLDLCRAESAAVRLECVKALAMINSRATRSALVELLDDPDANVLGSAAETAGFVQLQEAAGKLKKLMQRQDEPLALRAAASLAQLGDQSVVPFIVGIVEVDGPNTRLAARILGTILGKRFPANAEGISSARRYIEATSMHKVG